MTRHRSQQGERGAAALSLLTVGILVAIAIVAAMSIPLTRASDAKAKSNSAADAAALAGIEFVKNDLQVVLADKGWLGDWAAYEPARRQRPGLGHVIRRAQRVPADLVREAHAVQRLDVAGRGRGAHRRG